MSPFPEPWISIYIALVGLIVGSFLNVCIHRLPLGQSVVRPRSRCPRCGHEIRWYENVPIFSWIALGRRCSGCALPISWRYPAIELVSGLIVYAAWWRFGWSAAINRLSQTQKAASTLLSDAFLLSFLE